MAEKNVEIVVNGIREQKDPNLIKADLIAAGVPYGKAGKVFQQIGIEQGLLHDPEKVKEEITKAVEESVWDLEFRDDVEAAVQEIANEIPGATSQKVWRAVRAYCDQNNIELPKAKKVRTFRINKAEEALVATFHKHPEATPKVVFEAVVEATHEKAARGALKKYFFVIHAVSSGLSVFETKEKFAEDVAALVS